MAENDRHFDPLVRIAGNSDKCRQKTVAELPTQVVNDIGRYRQQLESTALSSGLTRDRDPESIIHCILEFLFAPDVALSCLDRSVAKQKLNLFQLAS